MPAALSQLRQARPCRAARQRGQSVAAQNRYSVAVEIAPAFDADQFTAADLDQDNLEAIAEEISMMDSTSDFKLPEPFLKWHQFDLCPACAGRYQRDPLGKESRRRFRISPN